MPYCPAPRIRGSHLLFRRPVPRRLPLPLSCLPLVAAGLAASAAEAQEPQPVPGTEAEIVVTGTLRPSAPTSVAVTTIDRQTLSQTAPTSAVDLLRNVPGVFVNSALGEVRNIVYSRGISANSNEAASGYYYVSLQEDGLPVTNVTLGNYTPDFFYRQDLGVDRVEALRGGTAVVTGPNAPGGIFNYISRTGKSDPGLELRVRLGLEGDGRNPFYRGDFRAGGSIGDSNLYYNVSGFYRHSVGPRDPGYALNRGGQIKANLLWDYGAGSLLVYGKYLDDHNGFQTFLPARNFENPVVQPGISRYGTLTIPAAARHQYVETVNGAAQSFDPASVVHSRSWSIGAKLEHEFGNDWTLRNNFKYADNRLAYNTQAVAFSVPLTESVLNTFLNATRSGVYSYRDAGTGQLLAQVRLAGGQRTVLLNELPNQQILTNGVVSQAAFNFNPEAKEVLNQFSVSKGLDRGSITLGGFFAASSVDQQGGGGGVGVSTLEDRPHMLSIALTTPDGQQFQLTDPSGFAAIGQRFGGTPFRAKQRQISLFAGADHDLTDALSIEGAARYEWIRNSGSNDVAVGNPQAANPAYGGIDGNPATLFDNYAVTYATPFRYRFDLDFLSFSGAATYKIDPENSLYVRYSQGKKAPDAGFFTTYDTLAELDNVEPIPQKIVQVEGGFKHRGRALRLALTPFYSRLSNVATSQIGTRADGTSYVPAPLLATTITYGLEVEGDVDFLSLFNLRSALTLQKGKSRDFGVWVFNAPGEADDAISRVPDGKLDNLPGILSATTLRFAPSERFTSFITWRHVGKRAANRYVAFYLPAYNEVDVGATLRLGEQATLGVNVNNIFNSAGVLSWAPGGSLLGALDRQSLTATSVAANPGQIFSIIQNQPRAFFVSAGVKF